MSLFNTHPVPGTVYLIGAGPGRADLITVRGLNILRQADVALYDRLTAPELLEELPPHAIRVYVGKKMGKHAVRQEDIQRMLIDFARQDRVVVRLKGGDPFVFGRGGEEALALARADVPFEVVPGVSAAVAAPAYAGIPVTHRGVARAFAVITGHHAANLPPMQTDWRVFSNIPTLVILMGITRVREIVEELLEAGRPEDTPAAVIEWATTPRQRVVRAALAELPDAVAREKVESPAVIVLGQVVKLGEELQWLGDMSNSTSRHR
jgi:uroporphyrin-III C-methyltransferase